jgi:hypothetical protein
VGQRGKRQGRHQHPEGLLIPSLTEGVRGPVLYAARRRPAGPRAMWSERLLLGRRGPPIKRSSRPISLVDTLRSSVRTQSNELVWIIQERGIVQSSLSLCVTTIFTPQLLPNFGQGARGFIERRKPKLT